MRSRSPQTGDDRIVFADLGLLIAGDRPSDRTVVRSSHGGVRRSRTPPLGASPNSAFALSVEQLLDDIGIACARREVEECIRLPFGRLDRNEGLQQFVNRSALSGPLDYDRPDSESRDEKFVRYTAERIGQRLVPEDRISQEGRRSRRRRWCRRFTSSNRRDVV
ncbi:Uncharacterised protein [Mycobacteroides abscessus subsp. abscessus]|nr:Uncharacterised protein [Mycobacteroides abscessus subsp. abscessus]